MEKQIEHDKLNALINELRALFPIPPQVAEAYWSQSEAMINEVDETLLALPTLSRLIGGHKVTVMLDNHRHHVQFMTNVFELNLPHLLVQVMVWVYRTHVAHGFSPDYFIVELNAWQKAVLQNLQPDFSAVVNRIYAWMLAKHREILALSSVPMPDILVPEPVWDETCQGLLDSLLRGESALCLDLIETASGNVERLSQFYLTVVQPVMYKVGSLWETGAISVAQEHLVTAIVSRAMAVAYQVYKTVPHTKGKVLITSAPNEYHELGGRIVADLLEFDGWDAIYLGTNTPAEDLADLGGKIQPFILGISVTMSFNLKKTRDTIALCRRHPMLRDTQILVGGLVFHKMPDLWKDLGADGVAANARDAMELANRWWNQIIPK